MKNSTSKIETGATLMARSIGDSECIFSVKVIERKKSFVTVKAQGNIVKVKIFIDSEGSEFCYAYGRYSMAPVFKNIIIK